MRREYKRSLEKIIVLIIIMRWKKAFGKQQSGGRNVREGRKKTIDVPSYVFSRRTW
jgi:hypothetical protein